VLSLSLTAPSVSPITVKYATSAVTATSGVDFTASSGTVSFAPGETVKSVTVTVLGDLIDEPDETFNVDLSSPVGATLVSTRAVVTIVDNDPLPSISINDVQIAEGKSGNSTATFSVSLSRASGRDITVKYATADGTATLADSDYSAVSGTLTFAAGATSAKVSVTVRGDTRVEPNETVSMNLSAPVNATLAKGTGILTITNDDK
jgi:chitinase